MTKILAGIFFVFTCFQNIYCQEYFQQEVNFDISVRLDDISHSLHAFETIEYINHSPDTLYEIYFHLWPNAYKNRNTALARQQITFYNKKLFNSASTLGGFIDSLNFKIGNKPVKWEYDEKFEDICIIFPEKGIPPGHSVIITTPFYVRIPSSEISRLGHDGQSYYITQWFPKPAVYDMYGWHQMPYLDMGEFYSEFGSFEVSITLPDNYIVAATGNLTNTDEIQRMNEKAEKTSEIKYFDESDTSYPPSSGKLKTLTYKEDSIHDFAWFADKRYYILKDSVIMPNTGKTVTTWCFFTGYNGNLWKKSPEYINDALKYYSDWYGDYPYQNCTAVDGVLSVGGGMEYPTITLISTMSDDLSLEQVIMHEVGHNWFYGILGSNERAFPWMDEGLNTFSDTRYTLTKYPEVKLYQTMMKAPMADFLDIYHLNYLASMELAYVVNARRGMDEAADKHSELYSAINYFTVVYSKNAYIFNYLMNYLGKEEFYRIMKIYYEKWKFRHPYPDDFRKIFTENSSKDISWFFDDVLGSDKHIDYKISKIRNEGDSCLLVVKNKGGINSPSYFSLINEGESGDAQWFGGFEGKKKFTVSGNFDKIALDPDRIVPDLYRKNDYIRRKGLFRKTEHLKLKFLVALENPEINYIYFTPIAGWNYNNGLMPGLLLYNSVLPMKKTEFLLMPLYSFASNDLAGNFRLQHHIMPEKLFRRVDLSASASQYAIDDSLNFQRYSISTEFLIKNDDLAKTSEDRLVLSATAVSDFDHLVINNNNVCKLYGNFSYTHSDRRKINPWSYSLYFNGDKDFLKGMIEAKYKISYTKLNKGLKLRLFAGKFLYSRDEYYGNYNFRLSGWNGTNDYMFDNVFVGRSEYAKADRNYFFGNQFVQNDGAFAVYSRLGQTDNWLVSLNASTSMPFKLPLRVYLNTGTYADIERYSLSEWFVYEAGVSLEIVPEVFEIWFPVKMSKDLKATSDFYYNDYWEKVRFTLYLNRLDPFKFLQNFNL